MNTPENPVLTPQEALQKAVREMEPQQAEELREAYYRAAEGLVGLNQIINQNSDPVLQMEGELFRAAQDHFDKSILGRIL